MHANPTEETVKLALDGETYKLFFALEAIAAAEDASGIPLITGLKEKDVNSPRISLVRAMLWGCLLPHQPKTTREEAAAMVTQWNWSKIWDRVLETWVAGMKPPAEAESDPTPGQS
jgi:hypothetical protein